MKGASQVMYTDPATGSRQAFMSGQILKRPEFAGVNGMPIKGDADRFIRNGTGDAKTLGLAIVQSLIPRPGQTPVDPILIGLLPAELGGHMDLAIAISARSENVKDAQSFITFMTGKGHRSLLRSDAAGAARVVGVPPLCNARCS
jgi:hypothetical protein